MSSPSEIDRGIRFVSGRALSIVQLDWRDGRNDLGESWDVYDVESGECLTEDASLDNEPTAEKLADLVHELAPAGFPEDSATSGVVVISSGGVVAHVSCLNTRYVVIDMDELEEKSGAEYGRDVVSRIAALPDELRGKIPDSYLGPILVEAAKSVGVTSEG